MSFVEQLFSKESFKLFDVVFDASTEVVVCTNGSARFRFNYALRETYLHDK